MQQNHPHLIEIIYDETKTINWVTLLTPLCTNEGSFFLGRRDVHFVCTIFSHLSLASTSTKFEVHNGSRVNLSIGGKLFNLYHVFNALAISSHWHQQSVGLCPCNPLITISP